MSEFMRKIVIAVAVLVLMPGAVFAGDNSNSKPRTIPGIHKVPDITLKRGMMSAERASQLVKALGPMLERTDTRAMRTDEAQYATELRTWAVKQNARLKNLKRIRARHNRLKSYRDRAATRGDDTSRIDPRLKTMERKMLALSGEIQQAHGDLESLQRNHRPSLKTMSNATKARHRQADDYLANHGN